MLKPAFGMVSMLLALLILGVMAAMMLPMLSLIHIWATSSTGSSEHLIVAIAASLLSLTPSRFILKSTVCKAVSYTHLLFQWHLAQQTA